MTKREEPNSLDTLAYVYAELGRFEDAVKAQEEAIARLSDLETAKRLTEWPPPEVIERYKSRLELYRQGKTCREEERRGAPDDTTGDQP